MKDAVSNGVKKWRRVGRCDLQTVDNQRWRPTEKASDVYLKYHKSNFSFLCCKKDTKGIQVFLESDTLIVLV